MTILIDASLRCNLSCKYCYNQLLREQHLELPNPDVVLKGLRTAVQLNAKAVCLHGGEPLTWGKDIVEELLRYIRILDREPCIQTNGLLIDDEWIEMFKRYDVQIGVSLDGLGELNRFRTTEAESYRIFENLIKLKQEGLKTGIIIVVHKANGRVETRRSFFSFLEQLSSHRITGRINPCTIDDPSIELPPNEMSSFYADVAKWMFERRISGWYPFQDIINLLTGSGQVTCTFTGCDPFHTRAGLVITPRGSLSVCHKFHETYIRRSPVKTDIRTRILEVTDCKGCKYFRYCKGGCPANALRRDWRRKTRWCLSWKTLFNFYSAIIDSLNVRPQRLVSDHGDHFEHVET